MKRFLTASALALMSCAALSSCCTVTSSATPAIVTECFPVEAATTAGAVEPQGALQQAFDAIDSMSIDDYAIELWDEASPGPSTGLLGVENWRDAQRPLLVLIGPRAACWNDPAVVAAAQRFRCVAVDEGDLAAWGLTSPAAVVCDFRWNIVAKRPAPTDVAGCLAVLEDAEGRLRGGDESRPLAASAAGVAGDRCADGSCDGGGGASGGAAGGSCATGQCASGACGKLRGLFGR